MFCKYSLLDIADVLDYYHIQISYSFIISVTMETWYNNTWYRDSLLRGLHVQCNTSTWHHHYTIIIIASTSVLVCIHIHVYVHVHIVWRHYMVYGCIFTCLKLQINFVHFQYMLDVSMANHKLKPLLDVQSIRVVI